MRAVVVEVGENVEQTCLSRTRPHAEGIVFMTWGADKARRRSSQQRRNTVKHEHCAS